jgi:hypothetical protein
MIRNKMILYQRLWSSPMPLNLPIVIFTDGCAAGACGETDTWRVELNVAWMG